jgi:hypothetical protein
MEQGQYVQLLQQTIEQQKEMLAQQSAALVRQQEQTERLHAMFMEHMTQQSAQKQAGDGNPEPKALNQTPTTKTPKAKEPDVFSTGPEKVERFLSEFATYMELTGLDKETARKRILYFKSYLRGPAHDWLKPIVDTSSFEKDSDYDHLIELFSKTFGDPDKTGTSVRKIRILRQKTSVSLYTAQFVSLASHLGWNDKALCDQYYAGLKDHVKDEISRTGKPATLEHMQQLALRTDGRYMERQLEKGRTFTPTITTNTAGPEPMQLDAAKVNGRIDQQERDRRTRLGLCFICAEKGHLSATCPQRTKNAQTQ